MEKELNKKFEFFNISWKAIYQTRLLPPFIMVKAKHNNKLKINVRGSGITKYISKGRKKHKPCRYICNFSSEDEGTKIQQIFYFFGIYPTLQIKPEIVLYVDYSDVLKFINMVNKNQKCKLIKY